MSLKPDPNSLSNALDVKALSLHLSLRVDFSKKALEGHVDHHVQIVTDGTPVLILDTKELVVHSVELVEEQKTPLQHKEGELNPVFGKPLEITIPPALRAAGSQFIARVHYHTSPNASALQWLEPSQTAGKKHPYLFSQCQAIHARSMVPCQDTPSNKIPYKAVIHVPAPLTALMSATAAGHTTTNGVTSFQFEQNIPIPTYLLALAVGHLESRNIGPRSRIWSEPEMVEAGEYEFANAEHFVKIGEDLLTPYDWGRYDMLLLPPSFPYGGMENPQLTFLTSTLLAGDRSLENVVAHEIAHSWTGNLVTNRYWSEFFLNEGFTTFIERKILARRENDNEVFEFEGLLGLKHLQDDIEHFGETNPLTALRPNLDGVDPDDAFSSVPYEKGFNLLCYLQQVVGIPKFERWLKAYVQQFRFQSITADQMKDHFLASFADVPEVKNVDWAGWFDKPGLPIVQVKFSTKLADAALNLAKRWVEDGGAGASPGDLDGFTTSQKVAFLDQLLILTEGKPFSHDVVHALDRNYSFSATRNSELRFRWYQLNLKSSYTPIFEKVVAFLTEQGRMKFVRPLYRQLHKHSEDGSKLAHETFLKHRHFYHAIAARLIAKDLGLE